MVVDGHTGKILYSRNGDALRYPASLTKIMTLYLLFDYMEAGKIDEDTRLTITSNAASQQPSKLGLKPGQTIRVGDAIEALVTKSANDVAVAVAENISGTEVNFARLMTAKARKIGMSKTVFKNASGLPDDEQVTTARDMITLANRLIFDHPERYRHFSTKYFTYKGRKYRNHNRLLFDYEGTDGIKTGYTRASGFNLLANVRRDDKHLIAVVFGGKTSKRRNATMHAILNKSIPRAIARAQSEQRVAKVRRTPIRKTAPQFTAMAPESSAPATERAASAQANRQTQEGSTSVQEADDGRFHIQVGAYARQRDALARLAAIQEKAGDVIKGHAPLAVPLVEPKRQLYRARFAGFTRRSAASTCSELKQRAITCVVMSAE